MIYGSSDHPVLVKKIRLNLWLLRHEVEEVVNIKLKQKKPTDVVTEVRDEYTTDGSSPISSSLGEAPAATSGATQESGELPDISTLDDSEDLMAQALLDVAAEEEGELPAGEDDMAAALAEAAKEEETESPAGEDDMAAALAAAASEEESPAGEDDMAAALLGGEESEVAVDEDDMAAALLGGDSNLGTEDAMAAAIAADSGSQPTKTSNDPNQIVQRMPPIPKEHLMQGVTILSEIGMEEIYFFSDTSIIDGQSIVMDFLVPNRFRLNAEVLYCRNIAIQSRIISKHKLPFRVCARFTFKRRGERTLLRQFLQSIEPDLSLYKEKKKAAPKQQEDDDDFSDLDDLDL